MSGYNGFNSGSNFDSIGLEGEDIPSMVGTGALRFNTTTRHLELSNDGAAWLQIGAGPAASIAAGTNINITTVGGNSVVSTVATPNFTDVTLGATSLAAIASTVTADLDQAVKTTSTPNFAGLTTTGIDIPGVGHTHIGDQNIQWPTGRMVFTQNITSSVEIGANAIYMKNIHSNGAGTLNLSDNMSCLPGVTIDGRDISVDGATLDSTVTTVGTLNGYLDQAVKTTSTPSFVGVNTTAINSTSGMTNQQKFTNWVDTDPYSSTGGERLSLYSDAGSVVTSGSRIGLITMGGATTATHNVGDGTYIETKSTQLWSNTAQGAQLNMYTCPNGSTIPLKALTIDQDQTTSLTSSLSWKNGLGTLTNNGLEPSLNTTNGLHISVGGADHAYIATSGTTSLSGLDALDLVNGLVANRLVIGTTGTSAKGGLRYNSGSATLEYYNGSAWTSSGTVVTAGTNMAFTGTALGTIANPTFSGLLTANAGLTTTINSGSIGAVNLSNTASGTFVQNLISLSPNITSGQRSELIHGVATSTFNCAVIDFNYAGSGSAANTVGLGFYGANNVFTADTGGNCKALGNLWAASNLIGTKWLGNSNIMKVQPVSGSASQDFYISSDQSDSVALQISPVNAGVTTYIKSNSSGKNIQFQGWVSGIPTNFINISDSTVFIDRLQCGSARNAVPGSINYNSGNLEFYNGAWNTLQTTNNTYTTFGVQVHVTNTSGTIGCSILGPSGSLGGKTYSCAIGTGNSSVDITVPGTINPNYMFQWSGDSSFCTPPTNLSTTISGGGTVVRIIPSYNTTGTQTWLQILPNNGDFYLFNMTVQT